ncbi:inositol monophosphatase family protein [Glycomyces tenuis]|uniref:inositol monophosphatase family protein n=1 Tax=Glycomyces tenuis TaxID=58116 RepID=UPI00040AEAB1|nr:inositol monophosphatase family protein [Glycomyces tenuis]
MTQLSEYLAIAERAADLAVELIESGRETRRTLERKGDRDFASDLDLAVEDRLREFLAEATPDIPLLGEERGVSGGTGSPYEWVLDPIDGTVNLVHGLPTFCVSLGLTRDGDPVVGVVDAPSLGERFSAAAGLGASLSGDAIACSATDDLAEALVALPDFALADRSPAINAERMRLIADLVPRVQRIRLIGSAALELCWVAAGRFDATVHPQANLWDVAAGVVIAREAGAAVLDRRGEAFGPGSASVVAAAPALASELCERLAAAV